MRCTFRSFNIYLAVLLGGVIALLTACKSKEESKRDHTYTRLWIHTEAAEVTGGTNQAVGVTIAGARFSASPRPFLTDEQLKRAEVVNLPAGGFALRVEFDQTGSLLLDSVTTQNRGKHLLIFADFGLQYKYAKKKNVSTQRWLAAPRISRRVTDGVLIFSVSATQEELDQLVLGLSNAAEQNAKPWTFAL